MTDYMDVQNQTGTLYQNAAKQLYNFALYAVGNAELGEQAAIRAFSAALRRATQQNDIAVFQRDCFRALYPYGREIHHQYQLSNMNEAYTEDLSRLCISDRKHLEDMLLRLNYDERFIVLLFCLHKYSVRQIAHIVRRPGFVIEKRLKSAVGKAMR